MGVADFHVGAQVFDTALVQHIAANLVTPAHIGFGVFQFLLGFHALAHFKVVKTRAQAFPGHVAVAVLAAAVLALHHDARRDVGQSHRRICFVDVLTASARRTKGIGAHISGVDVDLDRVVHLGIDKHTGKTGVSTTRRVERGFAHQAVHAGFGAQQTKSVFAFDFQSGALDTRHITRRLVFQRGLETFALGVFQILAQQHAGPVTGLGAARTRLDVQECVAGVSWIVEHAAEFELFDVALNAASVFGDGDQTGFVTLGFAHLEQLGVVLDFLAQATQGEDDVVQGFFFFAQLLGFFGVVPDRGVFQ